MVAGYLSEDNQESGFLDGPRDSAALAASSYTRLPQGMTMTPKIPPGFDGIMSWFEYEQLVDDWVALTTIEPARQRALVKNPTIRDSREIQGAPRQRTAKGP